MEAMPLPSRAPQPHLARLRGHAVPAFAAGLGIAASLATEAGPGGILAAGLAVATVAIATIDARRFLIPDGLNALGVGLGLAHAAALALPGEAVPAVALAGLRGVVTALAFLALRSAYFRLRGREGLGLGDVKLAAVAGVWLDWTTLPLAIDLAALAALAAIGIRQVATGRTMRATGRLPFGLFLAPAIFIGWLGERWLAAGI
ncbi:A24 family peptidase [Xanthobacter autotrophicus DSM 431]|uniref:prepilin peptidase n=1 Tax=Xanthobacter nonsaccharivorans TaxID=3119912 RepID=UPI00372C82D1